MAAASGTQTTSSNSNNPVAQNGANRRALIPGPNTQTIKRIQKLQSFTSNGYTAGQGLTFTVQPAPVGIITRFIVEVTASIGQGVAETQTRVQNGGAAFFSSVQYVDPSNQNRINVPSWYLNLLAMIRRRRMYGAAATYDINGVFGAGAAFTPGVMACPATLTAAPPAAGSPNYFGFFEIPLAYGHDDLRGAVFAGMYNATQSLQFTVNPNFFVTSTDVVNLAEAAYQSSSAVLGKIGSLTVSVYQEYIDNIGNLPFPQVDFATQYLLQTTGGYNPVANSDLLIPYQNNRTFLSTLFRYNNAGTFNVGSDLNYMAISSASNTDWEKVDPYLSALRTREHIGSDLPAGYYMFSHRAKPIFTTAAGNMNLKINASVVTSGNSTIVAGYEMLALVSALPAAAAIPSGS